MSCIYHQQLCITIGLNSWNLFESFWVRGCDCDHYKSDWCSWKFSNEENSEINFWSRIQSVLVGIISYFTVNLVLNAPKEIAFGYIEFFNWTVGSLLVRKTL